jgi:hypothetical protein
MAIPRTFIYLFFYTMLTNGINAQDPGEELPYRELPAPAETYTPGSVVSRLVDGLGFRYFWATEGLRNEDLAFRIAGEARSTRETIDHIYGLARVILNSALNKPNEPAEEEELSFTEMRSRTLYMLEQASDIFREAEDLDLYSVVFVRQGNRSEFPFWNQINGPISDALWHCGQVVSYRRASGNPFNPAVSVFTGKVRQ